jgi:outer membrane protein TolC
LRGAGNRVNTHSIRVAKYQRQIVDAQTKLEAIRILANADRAYWSLYAAQRELEVRQQQYELAVAQLDRARRRVRAGDAAEIEIIRAESGVAERLEAIIIAETAIRNRQRDLKRIMNRDDLPMDGQTALKLSSAPDPLRIELDAEELAAFAVANRMEMLELELQLAIDASTVDLQKNAALPLVTLDYNYSLNGLGASYGRAFDQIRDSKFHDWSIALNAEVPIGNEAAKARVHRALLQRLQRLATKQQREVAIRQEVFDALDALQQNWQRILAARLEVMLAGRTFEAEQRQFDVGARTSTDVLDAATRLADAQSREILALADYEIAQVDIAFATGTLLGRNRVRWEALDLDDLEHLDANAGAEADADSDIGGS